MSVDPDGNSGTASSKSHNQTGKYIDGQRNKHTRIVVILLSVVHL